MADLLYTQPSFSSHSTLKLWRKHNKVLSEFPVFLLDKALSRFQRGRERLISYAIQGKQEPQAGLGKISPPTNWDR